MLRLQYDRASELGVGQQEGTPVQSARDVLALPVLPAPPVLCPAGGPPAPATPMTPTAPAGTVPGVLARPLLPLMARAGRASVAPDSRLAAWADLLGRPAPEGRPSRLLARTGALLSVAALLAYLLWRTLLTLPPGGADRTAAVLLVVVEAVPLLGLVVRTVVLWSVDVSSPEPVTAAPPGLAPLVLVRTRDEPAEGLAATVAAACALAPAHETWVVDAGDRPWVARLCERYGARYLRSDSASDGDIGAEAGWGHVVEQARALLAQDAAAGQQPGAGREPVGVLALLDAGHVPLPTFLTHTLGWFADPRVALVQAPRSCYNAGSFEDDGDTGGHGVATRVVLPALQHHGVGPGWSGGSALLRLQALTDVGGAATATAADETATTHRLLRAGWVTRHHHQTVTVGMAPETPDRYLAGLRREALGPARLLVGERLWSPRRWPSWRSYATYLAGAAGWLGGTGLLLGAAVVAAVLLSGARTSTASSWTVALVFVLLLVLRMSGASLLDRGGRHWRTTAALDLLRVLVAVEGLGRLVVRRPHVPPVSAVPAPTASTRTDGPVRGRVPGLLRVLLGLDVLVLLLAALGLTGRVPWHTSVASVVPPGLWLLLATAVLLLAVARVRDPAYVASRRASYRVPVQAPVRVDGVWGELRDVSVGGVAVQVPHGALPASGGVRLRLPATAELGLDIVRVVPGPVVDDVSVRVVPGDWATYRELALWLFHTPAGVVDGLPPGVPAVAAVTPGQRSRRPVLVCEHRGSAADGLLSGGSLP